MGMRQGVPANQGQFLLIGQAIDGGVLDAGA